MSYARQMPDTYPCTSNVDADLLAAAIDALDNCAQDCNADNAADLRTSTPGTALRNYGHPRVSPPGDRCFRPTVVICLSESGPPPRTP